MREAIFEIINGVEGKCLSIQDANGNGGTRISGPKPWGGGHIEKTFKVDLSNDTNIDAICEAFGLRRMPVRKKKAK